MVIRLSILIYSSCRLVSDDYADETSKTIRRRVMALDNRIE